MILPSHAGAHRAERLIGRLLIGITFLAVLLLLIGVALLVGAGISPLAGGPSLDVGGLGADLVSLQPRGFLWLWLLAVAAAPIGRFTIATVSYFRYRDWPRVVFRIGVLWVLAAAVTEDVGGLTEGLEAVCGRRAQAGSVVAISFHSL